MKIKASAWYYGSILKLSSHVSFSVQHTYFAILHTEETQVPILLWVGPCPLCSLYWPQTHLMPTLPGAEIIDSCINQATQTVSINNLLFSFLVCERVWCRSECVGTHVWVCLCMHAPVEGGGRQLSSFSTLFLWQGSLSEPQGHNFK